MPNNAGQCSQYPPMFQILQRRRSCHAPSLAEDLPASWGLRVAFLQREAADLLLHHPGKGSQSPGVMRMRPGTGYFPTDLFEDCTMGLAS
jgi:hypothetical protein